jgi:hypothetical protein
MHKPPRTAATLQGRQLEVQCHPSRPSKSRRSRATNGRLSPRLNVSLANASLVGASLAVAKFPREVMMTAAMMTAMTPILIAFFRFLHGVEFAASAKPPADA